MKLEMSAGSGDWTLVNEVVTISWDTFAGNDL